MKKIISISLLMITLSVTSAQLNIQSQYENDDISLSTDTNMHPLPPRPY